MLTATDSAVHVFNLTVAATGTRSRGRMLLAGINFDLEAGRFVEVIGASGCGKSTLIKALTGEIKPAEGLVKTAL